MSYDLQVWSTRPVDAPAMLPVPEDWSVQGESWIHERRGWQVNIGQSVKVLPEDLPAGIERTLPGIGYLTELNLSPISAPEPARKFLSRAAAAIAKATHGVIFDPQTDQLILPSGIKRFSPAGASENASVLAMSWWFVEGPVADGEFGPLLDVLEATLPEALPRRYGSFEPPQHVYSETGRDHFIRFLADNLRGQIVVWYPSAPVTNVHLGLPENIGASKRGFRSARFALDVDVAALHQPGWPAALKRLWIDLSRVLRPFYGDVRTLAGYRRNRGRYWVTRATQHHPVIAWWWCGLPPGPAQAIVLGPPYRKLWTDFEKVAVEQDGLALVSTEDWTSGASAFDRTGTPPQAARIVHTGALTEVVPREYPTDWPFGPPRVP
jgi:hypothetical protein